MTEPYNVQQRTERDVLTDQSNIRPNEYRKTQPAHVLPKCRLFVFCLITLPHLAKFRLVWRRLCEVLFASCLFEHTLTVVCVQREYQAGRKYNVRTFGDHQNVLYIFDQTCIVLKSGWSSTARMPRLVVSPPSFSPSAPDSTAKPMASSHHFTPPRQVSARLAPPV